MKIYAKLKNLTNILQRILNLHFVLHCNIQKYFTFIISFAKSSDISIHLWHFINYSNWWIFLFVTEKCHFTLFYCRHKNNFKTKKEMSRILEKIWQKSWNYYHHYNHKQLVITYLCSYTDLYTYINIYVYITYKPQPDKSHFRLKNDNTKKKVYKILPAITSRSIRISYL